MIAVANSLGRLTLRAFSALGHAAFFFVDLLRYVPGSLRRFGLVVRPDGADGEAAAGPGAGEGRHV